MADSKPDPNCGNCDGIGCMDCRLRVVHDRCVNDCPDCYPEPDSARPETDRIGADVQCEFEQIAQMIGREGCSRSSVMGRIAYLVEQAAKVDDLHVRLTRALVLDTGTPEVICAAVSKLRTFADEHEDGDVAALLDDHARLRVQRDAVLALCRAADRSAPHGWVDAAAVRLALGVSE